MYHAENIGLFGKPYRGAVKEDNRTTNLCGFGSHHQNEIADCKIQTLMLGYRTFLLHAKHYWPEVITMLLWTHTLKQPAKHLKKINV